MKSPTNCRYFRTCTVLVAFDWNSSRSSGTIDREEVKNMSPAHGSGRVGGTELIETPCHTKAAQGISSSDAFTLNVNRGDLEVVLY